MDGWLSEAADWASRRNLAWKIWSLARSVRSVLIATIRSSLMSRARDTSAMRPRSRRGCVISRTVPNHPAFFLVSVYIAGDDVDVVGPVEVGEPVGLDELLAEEDGLVGGELLGDVVGLTDLVGSGLPIGSGTTEGFPTGLDVGVGISAGLWLTWWVCVPAGELRCCAELVSTFPLPRPDMCPVRYNPAAAAAAHRTAVEPAAISWRRRLVRRRLLAPRGGVVPASPT